jgi:HSP20 family protein
MHAEAESGGRCQETSVDKLRDLVAGWIDTVASQGGKTLDNLGLRAGGRPWIPQVDIVESDDHVEVSVDLPGADPNQVEILLAGNMLTVKGSHVAAETPGGRFVHRRERPTGSFSRSIALPVSVNPEKVSADSKHGVLTIRLGKEDRIKPRHIPIDVHAPPPAM